MFHAPHKNESFCSCKLFSKDETKIKKPGFKPKYKKEKRKSKLRGSANVPFFSLPLFLMMPQQLSNAFSSFLISFHFFSVIYSNGTYPKSLFFSPQLESSGQEFYTIGHAPVQWTTNQNAENHCKKQEGGC